MDINTLRQWIARRDSFSILETVDVHTGVRSVLKEFDYIIEAPNWTQDSKYLVYKSRGHMYTYELATGEIKEIDAGFALDCNNDHVLSPDNTQLAVSHFTNEDATSRIVGNLLFDSNSIFIFSEKPSLVLFGTMGIMYMADPNNFGGDVRVILKGNNEPFTMQQSHAFSDECRGLGVAEMAWSMRMGRKNRANKEMAYHALEVLHGIVKSSETRSNQVMKSTFEKTPPIPRGYSGQTFFEFVEETGIAL